MGPGQCPLLSLGWAEMGQRVAAGREAHCCDGWGDKLRPSSLTSHWHPPSSRSDSSGQEDLQGFGTAENLLLSQMHCGWIPSAASWRVRETDQISLDILGISCFIISDNVWIGVYSDASSESSNRDMLSWECLSNFAGKCFFENG